eukprot:4242128-Karenia_brevis.AAC.1
MLFLHGLSLRLVQIEEQLAGIVQFIQQAASPTASVALGAADDSASQSPQSGTSWTAVQNDCTHGDSKS